MKTCSRALCYCPSSRILGGWASSRTVTFDELVRNGITWRVRDLPGQLQFYATNGLFLTADRCVVLIVINLAEQESVRQSELLLWLRTMQRLRSEAVDKCRVLIVGTHLDGRAAARWLADIVPALAA